MVEWICNGDGRFFKEGTIRNVMGDTFYLDCFWLQTKGTCKDLTRSRVCTGINLQFLKKGCPSLSRVLPLSGQSGGALPSVGIGQ